MTYAVCIAVGLGLAAGAVAALHRYFALVEDGGKAWLGLCATGLAAVCSWLAWNFFVAVGEVFDENRRAR